MCCTGTHACTAQSMQPTHTWPAAPLPSPAPQPAAALEHGCAYRLVVTGPGGARLIRRDPWARSADPSSSWCFAHSPAAYTWKHTGWQPLSYDRVGGRRRGWGVVLFGPWFAARSHAPATHPPICLSPAATWAPQHRT